MLSVGWLVGETTDEGMMFQSGVLLLLLLLIEHPGRRGWRCESAQAPSRQAPCVAARCG